MSKKKIRLSSKSKKFLAKFGNFFKSIYNFIYKIFKNIYIVIDKLIITPLSKLLLLIMKLLKANTKPVDRLLNNKAFLIIFSLVLALTTFFIIDNTTTVTLNNSADILYGQEVSALYNEEGYVVEGLPETVDITLIGRRADLYLAKQYPNDDVVVDLRGLKPGSHKVKLKYNGSVSSVEYKLDPSTATVVIYEKVSEARDITSEVLYEKDLDSRYTITDISLSRDEVYVKGAAYKLEQVAIVKALIDVRDIINPTVGTTTLKDVALAAYDVDGNKIDVEIVPETIDATIQIASPSKQVPFKVIPEGKVVFGKAINTISLSSTKATIYGSLEELASISYIPVKIDVSDLSKDTEFNVNVSRPSGVNEVSVKSLVVKVTLGYETETIIKNVNINIRNLDSNYTAQASSAADSVISVIAKGTSTNLAKLTKDNITAYVDLQGLGVGSHKVTVQVTGDDLKCIYTPKTTKVTIVIKKN